jgi:hypothetical protein
MAFADVPTPLSAALKGATPVFVVLLVPRIAKSSEIFVEHAIRVRSYLRHEFVAERVRCIRQDNIVTY